MKNIRLFLTIWLALLIPCVAWADFKWLPPQIIEDYRYDIYNGRNPFRGAGVDHVVVGDNKFIVGLGISLTMSSYYHLYEHQNSEWAMLPLGSECFGFDGFRSWSPFLFSSEGSETMMICTRQGLSFELVDGKWENNTVIPFASKDSSLNDAVLESSGVATAISSDSQGVYSTSYKDNFWSQPIKIIDGSGYQFGNQSLTEDGDGNLSLIGTNSDGAIVVINYNNGSWTVPRIISTEQLLFTPISASDGRGITTAVWATTKGIISLQSKKGVWDEVERFIDDQPIKYLANLSISNGYTGSQVIVWAVIDAQNKAAVKTSNNSGEGWGNPAVQAIPFGFVDVVSDAFGNSTLVSAGSGLQAIRYEDGSWSSEPVKVGSYSGAFKIASTAKGEVAIIYSNLPLVTSIIGGNYNLLSVRVNGNGVITSLPSKINCGDVCTANLETGSYTTLKASSNPNSGYAFSHWDGACSGNNECQILMDKDKSVTATYTALQSYKLKANLPSNGFITSAPGGIDCGYGKRSCSYSFFKGQIITLTATPKEGYINNGWSGCQVQTPSTCSLTVSEKNPIVKALFRKKPKYRLTITKNNLGLVLRDQGSNLICAAKRTKCVVNLTEGTSLNMTLVPKAGHTYLGWSGDCSGSTQNCSLTMDGPKNVQALFQ